MEVNLNRSTVSLVLKMEDAAVINHYSFPLFVPEYEMHSRKIPAIYFVRNNQLVKSPERLHMTGKEMVQAAFSHLRELDLKWQVVREEGAVYLFCTAAAGEDVAGKVLDPIFMQQAASLLNAAALLVMIPHSGIILVAAETEGTAPHAGFLKRAKAEFGKLSVQVLSDLAFVYTHDRVTAVKEVLRQHANMLEEKGQSELAPLEGQVLKVIEVPVFTGDFFYKVEIGAGDDMQLIDLCEKAIFYLLGKGVTQHKFLGIIEFVIDRSYNAYAVELEDKIARFWVSVEKSGKIKELSSRLKRNIELSIIFGEDFASGQLHRKKRFKKEYYK